MDNPVEAIKKYLIKENISPKTFSKLCRINYSQLLQILGYSRKLSLTMIRNIHYTTKIPLKILIQDYERPNKI